MPVKAVTLDAFGTLFDLDVVTLPAVESIIARLGLALRAEPVARVWTRRFHALHQSCALACLPPHRQAGESAFRTIRDMTEQTLGEALSELGVLDIGTADIVRGTGIWFDHVMRAPLYPEVREAVGRLASRFGLAVITDADDDYFIPAWERSGLHPVLAYEPTGSTTHARPAEIGGAGRTAEPVMTKGGLVFTSSSSRSYKLSPGGALFRRAFEALGVEPEEVAHVGDMHTDVVGATAAGAQTVWLSRSGRQWSDGRAKPTLVARDLAEAAEMLVRGRE